MKKILLGLSAALMISTSLIAQDVHFTQYFTSPLTLNPALTGLTSCDLRFASNYRVQWSSISANPYVTGTLSYDMAVAKGKLPEGDALGLGVLALYDKSGSGGLTNETVGLSLAYHKALGVEKQHTISLGIQAVLVQKTLDFTKLTFEDQFDPSSGSIYTGSGGINPTNEHFGNADITYPDFNAGAMYSGHVTEHATAYAGFSYYHITQPVETFMGSNHQLHSRQTAYLGGSFDLNENMVLYASALYQAQASASEELIGAAMGIILNPGHDMEFQKNTVLYIGGWYRYGDAISPYVGLAWSKMQLGFSYDVNISSFTPATGGAGGYELSLVFNGCINKHEAAPKYNFACPRF